MFRLRIGLRDELKGVRSGYVSQLILGGRVSADWLRARQLNGPISSPKRQGSDQSSIELCWWKSGLRHERPWRLG